MTTEVIDETQTQLEQATPVVPNLRDIKGIGDGKADALEKAILDFTEECCIAKRKAA